MTVSLPSHRYPFHLKAAVPHVLMPPGKKRDWMMQGFPRKIRRMSRMPRKAPLVKAAS